MKWCIIKILGLLISIFIITKKIVIETKDIIWLKLFFNADKHKHKMFPKTLSKIINVCY